MNIRASIVNLFKTGFFSIVVSNVLSRTVAFCGGMILVRVLTKSEYGTYTYVLNALGILILLSDFGTADAFSQFGNEEYKNPEKRDAYLAYGLKRGLMFSGFTAILVLFSPLFYPFTQEEAKVLTMGLFLTPFINTLNLFLKVNLRVRLKNNAFSALNIFSSTIHYVIILPAAYWFGVSGAVYSNYAIIVCTLLGGFLVNKGIFSVTPKSQLLTDLEKKSFLKLAFASQLNSAVDHLLMLLDVFCIGIFISNQEIIASYKVSTTIPSALLFIPISIMVYFTAYFSRKIKNIMWVKKTFNKIIMMGFLGYGIMSIIALLISPYAIPVIFGKQYSDAVTCFNILIIGFFFTATFRIPSNNVIYTQRKVRVNIIITFISTPLNIVFNIILINLWGAIGAAVATTSVMFISSMISFGYIQYYLKKRMIDYKNTEE